MLRRYIFRVPKDTTLRLFSHERMDHRPHINDRLQASQILTQRLFSLLFVLIAASVIWRGFPLASLWLDETLTYWIIKDGFADAYSRVLKYQGQSPLYYLLLWLTTKFTGYSELALRMPSILATIVSCLTLSKLSARWVDRSLALFAVLIFISIDQVLIASMSARPYALGLMCAMLSIDRLDRWIDKSHLLHGVVYLAYSLLTFYFQYLFALIFIIHIAWIASRKTDLAVGFLRNYLIVVTFGSALLIPGLMQLYSLLSSASSFGFALRPGYLDLLTVLFPTNICVYTILSVVICLLCGAKLKFSATNDHTRKMVLPLLAWWLLAPITFFLASLFSETSIFIQRYFLWTYASVAILLSMLVQRIQPVQLRWMTLSVFALLTLLGDGTAKGEFEDWRRVPAILRDFKLAADSPIFLYSGLVESKEIAWLDDEERRGYFLAPFSYYRVDQDIVLLPPSLQTEQARAYATLRVTPLLSRYPQIVLICRRNFTTVVGDTRKENCSAIQEYFQSVGFKLDEAKMAGLVLLSKYTRDTRHS